MTSPADQSRKQVAWPTASDLLELTSRPVRLITHPAWSEARETILALVTAGPSLVAVLGPPGTGKTTLLHDLATTFDQSGRDASLLDFGDSPLDVGSAEIVLVDEADRMSATRLDELRGRGDRAIVLAALPASRERFECYPDITIVQLAPLSPEEACAFLAERLAQLGLPNTCLTEAAWGRIIVHCRGVPRLLLGSLGLALFLAREDQATQVTDAHVEEAVAARRVDLDARTVEPTPTEPDRTQESVFAIPAGTEVAEAGLHGAGGNPPRGRLGSRTVVGLYMAAVVAAYLVPAVALLTWGAHRQMDHSASPAPHAPMIVETAVSKSEAPAGVASTPHSVSEAPDLATMTAPIPVPKVGAADVQLQQAASAGAAPSEPQAATTTQQATIAIATKPLSEDALPPVSADDLPHRCSDGQWSWSTCSATPRRVVWRRVRRSCPIHLGSLCL